MASCLASLRGAQDLRAPALVDVEARHHRPRRTRRPLRCAASMWSALIESVTMRAAMGHLPALAAAIQKAVSPGTSVTATSAACA